MGVDLKKVEDEAPHLVSLVKQTGVTLEKKGLKPHQYPAAVIGTLDYSGSAERLYQDGTMQRTADLAFAAGLVLDDDGEVPFSLFDHGVHELGEVNLGNCQDFVDRATRGKRMGGTNYSGALQWIIEEAGFGNVNLGSTGGGGFLGRSKGNSALSVKATAPYPTFAIFATDGEPQDSKDGIRELLTLMSQLPIFVQFIGVGSHRFEFLRELDELDGRLIDNANFFDSKDAGGDQEKMLELMLGEFPEYYGAAKRGGFIQ